jgi:hypothetical protein
MRTTRLYIRMSQEERAELLTRAGRRGLSVSDYVRCELSLPTRARALASPSRTKPGGPGQVDPDLPAQDAHVSARTPDNPE